MMYVRYVWVFFCPIFRISGSIEGDLHGPYTAGASGAGFHRNVMLTN